MGTMHPLQAILEDNDYRTRSYRPNSYRDACFDAGAIAKAFRSMREDSMGTGTICYFPGAPYTAPAAPRIEPYRHDEDDAPDLEDDD